MGVPIRGRPILEKEIRAAQAQTKSGAEAARFLGVNILTYKKYAKMYGLFDQHKNPTGKGIRKGHKDHNGGITLDDILAGKHPTYKISKLKRRLLDSKTFEEKCSLCGFNERRILDARVPLMLIHIDGDKSNHKKENLRFMCFNCTFLTANYMTSTGKLTFDVEKESLPETTAPRVHDNNIELTEDERKAILKEIGHDT